jgi:hypothetical protein
MAAIVVVVIALVGVGLLIAGEHNSDAHHAIWRAVLLNLGGLFVASATLAFVWEIIGKRVFSQEVLAAAGVGADTRAAGLRAISGRYLDVADWPDLFRHATEIDLVVSWGATWRRTYEREINEWIGRARVTLRVLLPDPTDDELVAHLAKRFDKTPEYVRERINETASYYEGLQARAGGGSSVAVRFISRAPVWSYYRLGAIVVATLYPASLASTPEVTAFVVEERGEMGQFFTNQFEACWTEAQEEA